MYPRGLALVVRAAEPHGAHDSDEILLQKSEVVTEFVVVEVGRILGRYVGCVLAPG